jgi:L-threonylcarbamoyladenylate synthase
MKRPKILDIDVSLVDNAVTHWREGGLVAIPTETVYGLAADATNGQAIARIYALKSRPQFNPLIVHVADVRAAIRYVEWNDMAERLAEAFWPGPLTLVLKRRARSRISELVSAGGDTLAVRVPAHPVALQLLQAFNGAIAAPSANRSGRVSPTTAQHVRDEFGADAPLIIDGGPCEVGLESTVLDISGEAPVLLRAGAITRQMLEAALNCQLGAQQKGEGALKSPGMLASHYAPSIPVRLNALEVRGDEALLAFGPAPLVGAATTLNLSARGDVIEAAANLFAHLRALDDPRHRAIAVMPIPSDGIGEAIHDRLKRASV